MSTPRRNLLTAMAVAAAASASGAEAAPAGKNPRVKRIATETSPDDPSVMAQIEAALAASP